MLQRSLFLPRKERCNPQYIVGLAGQIIDTLYHMLYCGVMTLYIQWYLFERDRQCRQQGKAHHLYTNSKKPRQKKKIGLRLLKIVMGMLGKVVQGLICRLHDGECVYYYAYENIHHREHKHTQKYQQQQHNYKHTEISCTCTSTTITSTNQSRKSNTEKNQ